ncbi:MAG TPA: hypothetical protein VFP98_06765, partial [Candidatus Polarisedimenticolia bacterium]|nr:hypothetical protein [Candidatus Polarisedimenticolia bacterium]
MIGGLGYLVGRARSIDLAPITGLTVLVLSPAIVFDSLARAALPRDLLLRSCCSWRRFGCSRWSSRAWSAGAARRRGGLLLATLFANSGTVGLPLALFAGLAIAGGWFAVMSIG